MSDKNNDTFGGDILSSLFKPPTFIRRVSLQELFDQRVSDLKISPTSVIDILKISYRTLNGILQGTQKTVDFTNLIKLADFLQISKEQAIHLYLEVLEKNFPSDVAAIPRKIEFIRENFDLAALKKAGFINSISDYDEIETKIVTYFGLKQIFDYKRPPVDVAFSAGIVKPKNELTRSMWIKSASDTFTEIANPYPYDRQALVNYFPQIRWHSTGVELGLVNVIRDLFKMGITVIYQSPLPSLHLRGATFSVNEKPCVVLTNYVGFYPTLWFALVHELFHVIFDWEEISKSCYHLSDDESDQLSVQQKEEEADNFAREYLFSKEKSKTIRPYLNNAAYVSEFAKENHVHPSFVYVFNDYDVGKTNRAAWGRAKKENPDASMKQLLAPLTNPWDAYKPIAEYVKSIKYKLYQ